MVALLVLGVGLGSALLAMSTARRWVHLNRLQEFALHCGREAIETVGGRGYDDVQTGQWIVLETNQSCNLDFVLTYRATEHLSGANLPWKEVTVVTSWPSPFTSGRVISNQFDTVIVPPLH